MEEERLRVALLLCQAKGEHSKLEPQELGPLPGEQGEAIQSGQVYMMRTSAEVSALRV